jgi:hypothetical protein
MLKRILFLFALAFMASPLVFAQITTSSVSGVVKSTTDESLVGASVVATHLPSGTKYSTTSRAGGVFAIGNMRVGGPYLIEVTFVGYDKEKYDDVYLKLAESFDIYPLLKKTNSTLENVVLTTGGRSKILNANRTGAVTNIGIRQITQLPSISRSINDYTRATPQSNGVSIGGGNYRQNNFTVDGADFNNTFGISTGAGNLPAGGSPISIDAIEEISVNITPFDVRQSGFIGAGINAVTRSGTNTFSGSVYEYFRTERLRGRRVEKTYFVRPPEEFKHKGFRFSGPIIKNKLFFFMNYEVDNTPVTLQSNFAATAGAAYGSASNIARPTADSMNAISQYLLTNYGYVTGIFDNYTVLRSTKKIMGRIDWNINAKNHLNFRYSQVKGGTPALPSTSFSGIVPSNSAPSGGGRTAVTALPFKNSNYLQGLNFYSFSGELNSTFGRAYNTLRGSFTYQDESRSTDSQIFPFVDILSSGGGVSSPAVYTSFGYEPFTFGNLRKVKTYSFTDNLRWTIKKHSWVAGVQAEFSTTINGFQRAGTSYYEFNTWNDFATGQKPIAFGYTYSLSKDFTQAFPSFKSIQYSAYLQDEISVTKNFKLTVGARVDQTGYPSVPEIKTHPLIIALTFADGQKVNTGALPGKKIQVSPRIGFNWDLYGDRSLQVRGGTGIFAGRVPFVWIVSQSGDAGLLQVTQSFSGASVPGPFNPDPRAYYPSTPPPAGTVIPSVIEVVDPSYKNPQTWKSSVAIDTKLPMNMIGTIEVLFNKDIYTPYFKSINLVNPSPLNVAGYPDNRMIYPSVASGTNYQQFINRLTAAGQASPAGTLPFNVYKITNGTRGYYFSLTGKIEKPFTKGFFASIAYTKSLAGNLYDGFGDQPGSAWQGIQTVNGSNNPVLGYTSYVVPDRIVATFSYRKEYFKHLVTNLSFIYQGAIDYRFSYTYSTDFNRDGTTGNDLIYIPKDARNTSEIQFVNSANINGIIYTGSQQAQLFEDYINQDKYLSKHRGQYAERNGATAPWRNQVDARFMQDLFAKTGKNRNTFQFTVDIFNLGNLINPSWGKTKATNASAILVPQNATALVPGGSVVPTFRLNTSQGQIVTRTFRDVVSTASTYSVQFGLRYMFN